MRTVLTGSASQRGASMMVALMLLMMCAIAVTAMLHLIGVRLRQSESVGVAAKRRLIWSNTEAVNRQYAYVWGLRDDITRSSSTGSLASGWGGAIADAFSDLSAFRATQRPSDQTHTYPYNNVRIPPTSDSGYFYVRTTSNSDSNQTEHVTLFNYLKTYPAPLLGDLLILHTRDSAASGDYYISDNLKVEGRVVIYDATAQTTEIRAESCMHMKPALVNATKNLAGSAALLPDNYPVIPTATAGYGGTSSPYAVTNGTLNMVNNTTFTAGSVRHIMEDEGNWQTQSGSSVSGNSSSPVQVTQPNSPTSPYTIPASPYNYSYSGKFNTVIVRLKNSTLKHLRINGDVDQLILEGQSSSSDYTAAGSLPPVIIWLEQATTRDIRFVGENSRRLILAVSKGTGSSSNLSLYMGFHGSSLVSGGPLRWRMQLISEFRPLYFNPPSGLNVAIIGGIRTNWTVNCTDTGSGIRVLLQRDTSPGALETLLPRDGWLETYFLVR